MHMYPTRQCDYPQRAVVDALLHVQKDCVCQHSRVDGEIEACSMYLLFLNEPEVYNVQVMLIFCGYTEI